MPPEGGILVQAKLLVGFALLVSNAAAGFASRLAGGLALAATAFFRAIAKIFGFQSLDVFHICKPPKFKFLLL